MDCFKYLHILRFLQCSWCWITIVFLLNVNAYEQFEAAFQGQCRDPGVPCQHICKDHTSRTFECFCWSGFQLEHNGYSCTPFLNKSQPAGDSANSVKFLSDQPPASFPYPPSHVQFNQHQLSQSPCTAILCLSGGLCAADHVHGYRCLCPLGRKGKHCEYHVVISKPKFNGDAYVMLPMPTDWEVDFEISLEIQAETENGLLLYSGENLELTRDFVVLELVEGYVTFRLQISKIKLMIQSRYKIPLGDLVKVRVGRRNADVFAQVAGEDRVVTTIQEISDLNVKATENIYLGGITDYDKLTLDQLASQSGFVGCVLSLKINGKKFVLEPLPFGSILQGINLDHCNTDSCQGITCLNNGECIPDENGSAKCDCQVPFVGNRCEIGLETHIPSFNGTSYLMYEIPERSLKHTLHFQLTFRPTSVTEAVLLHIGDANSDTLQLLLDRGHLEIALDLGEGFTVARSETTLQRDEWYKVNVRRTGRFIELILEGHGRVETMYNGAFTELNISKNVLYIGGLDYNAMRSDKSSFRGCIDLNKSEFMRMKLKLSKVLIAANLDTCRSS